MSAVNSTSEALCRLAMAQSPGAAAAARCKAQLLADVCERTGQLPEEIDQAKLVSDHKHDTSFHCPVLLTECNKVVS